MSYLISQLWLYLFIAFILGSLLGWLLRGDCKRNLAKMVKDWEDRMVLVEGERDHFASKAQDTKRSNHEQKSLLNRLSAMENGANLASNALKENKEMLDSAELEIAKLKSSLVSKDQEIIKLKAFTVSQEEFELLQNQSSHFEEQAKQVQALLDSHLSDQTVNKNTALNDEVTLQKQLDLKSIALSKLEKAHTELKEESEINIGQLDVMQALVRAHEEGSHELSEKEKKGRYKLLDLQADNEKNQRDMINKLVILEKKSTDYKNRLNKAKEALKNQQNQFQDQELEIKKATEKSQKIMTEQKDMISNLQGSLEEKSREAKSLQLALKEVEKKLSTDKASRIRGSSELESVSKKLTKPVDIKTAESSSLVLDTTLGLKPQLDYPIEEIEGISKGYGKCLRKIGIETVADFRRQCVKQGAVKNIANKLNVDISTMQSWVSMADLLRIDGINGQYAELLFYSGVQSTNELLSLDATKIALKMKNANNIQQRIKKLPELEDIVRWIEIAKRIG